MISYPIVNKSSLIYANGTKCTELISKRYLVFSSCFYSKPTGALSLPCSSDVNSVNAFKAFSVLILKVYSETLAPRHSTLQRHTTTIWNCLTSSIRSSQTLDSSRKHFKSILTKPLHFELRFYANAHNIGCSGQFRTFVGVRQTFA